MKIENGNVDNSTKSLNDEAKEMTHQQRERYNAIYHIYGDESEEIVKMVKGRSNLSWTFIFNSILTIYKAKFDKQEYYKAIKQTFELETEYSETDICQMVSEIRADLGLQPYSKRIAALCLEDFQLVFMCENVKAPGQKRSNIHKGIYCLVK